MFFFPASVLSALCYGLVKKKRSINKLLYLLNISSFVAPPPILRPSAKWLRALLLLGKSYFESSRKRSGKELIAVFSDGVAACVVCV